MDRAQIRDDVDPNSEEYRRALIWVAVTVLSLGGIGGACLGYKITGAESAAKDPGVTQPAEESEQP
jgi:hypothetical protein